MSTKKIASGGPPGAAARAASGGPPWGVSHQMRLHIIKIIFMTSG